MLPDIVARVNGEEIRKEDVAYAILQITGRSWTKLQPYERDELLRRAVDDLIQETLLAQEAQGRGVTVDDAELTRRQQAPVTIVSMGTVSADQQRALVEQHRQAEANLSPRARKRMFLAGKILAEAFALPPDPSDAEVKAFYAAHPEMFQREETVRENHIFIAAGPDAGAGAKRTARQSIDALLTRVRAGEDFGQLARRYSEDASARGGGDQNDVTREDLRELGATAFAMTPGQVSDVITTADGYYVMKVTDRKPAGIVPFEEAAPDIKHLLKYETVPDKAAQWETFLQGLRQKATIEVLI